MIAPRVETTAERESEAAVAEAEKAAEAAEVVESIMAFVLAATDEGVSPRRSLPRGTDLNETSETSAEVKTNE